MNRLFTSLWFVVGLVACAAPGPVPVLSERELLLDYLASEFRPDAPGGVVLILRGDEVVLREAFGLADLSRLRSLESGDSLPIGSITKSFTAGAVLRLVDEGVFELDDDIREHVPDAPTDGRRVTLEQLLRHTSGMPNFVDRPDFEELAQRPHRSEELVGLTEGMDWLSEPGTEVHYSDSGYILLGRAVELATGEDFDRFVVEELAGPLGMTRTYSAHRPRGGEPLGYSGGELAEAIDMSVAHAAGQLASTVDDLATWVRAWEAGEVVSRGLATRAWEASTLPGGTRTGYGYGWKRQQLAGRTCLGHGGWVPGFTAALLHLPEEGLTAAVLVNTDDSDPEASYVARRALRLLLTGSPFVPTVELERAQCQRLVGEYVTAQGSQLSVLKSGDALALRFGDDEAIPLVALGPTRLAVADSDGTWVVDFEVPPGAPAHALRTSLSGEPRLQATRVTPR